MDKKKAYILLGVFVLIAVWVWGKNLFLAAKPKNPAVAADVGLVAASTGPTERVGPRTTYTTWGKDPFYVKGQEEAVPAFSLEGVIMDPVSPYAVINGEIKKEGEEIQGAKVVKITEDRVVLKIGKREITLTMF